MDNRIPLIGVIVVLIALIFLYTKINGKEYPKNLFYGIKNPADIAKIFPKTSKELTKRVQAAMADAKAKIDAIIAIPDDQRTFANTVQEFDTICTRSDLVILANAVHMINFLNRAAAMRETAQTKVAEILQFITEQLENNPKLYRAIKAYVQNKASSENLSTKQRYFLEELMKQFKRNGLELPEEKQEQVRALKNEITKIALQFEENISKDGNKTITVSREELTGLPDDFIDALKKTDGGNYLVAVDYATYDRVMTLCSIESTRKKLWETFNNRAYPVNEELLKKMIAKRQEYAALLGYKNYAELNIDDTMAATPTTVDIFITDLISKVKPKKAQEFLMLTKELPEGVNLTSDGKINPWDFGYLKEYYKRTHLQLDEQKIAEYFPMEKTVDGLMRVYETFFNLTFTKIDAHGLWSDDLTILCIADGQQQKLLGYLILDLYPREGKYSHACHESLIPSLKITGEEDRPWLGIIIANFPKSTQQKPSLLKRGEVQTFFHELGHALHSLFARQEIGSFAGTNVKFDFVEVPSQMFEEWLFDPEILRMVSSHYLNGDLLPDEIINKIIDNKALIAGFFVQRQGFLSTLSLRYYQSVIENPLKIYQQLYIASSPDLALNPNDHMYASFGHLPDYGARYYTYAWSKVIAIDLASEIKKQGGFLNPAVGKRLRETILAEGGSQDPAVLVRNFLGRDFTNEAFLKDIGI